MVEQAAIDNYVQDRLKPQIKWYDDKSSFNQKWAVSLQVLVIILSAITPVLAAFELQMPTIITSTLVAIMAGLLKFFKFEEHWHNYRTTCETLKKEKIIFDASISPYDKADEPKALFIERCESLISKENTTWVQTVKKKEDK